MHTPAGGGGGGGEWKLRCSEGVWVQVGGLWGDVVPALASKMLQVCVCVGEGMQTYINTYIHHIHTGIQQTCMYKCRTRTPRVKKV
jgi:hypothetical protein